MGAQQELANAIDKILWEDWDPIGMKNLNPKQSDEYSGYVPEIFSLALGNSSTQEIAARLESLAEELGGVDINHCKVIAEKIISVKKELIP